MKFTQKIYELTSKIPVGYVATYGQLARLAGSPQAARAVGLAMKTNPNAPIVPCHRVVAASGKLTGYSGPGGIDGKRKMLIKEGVKFIGDKVDLSLSLWKVPMVLYTRWEKQKA